MLTEVTFIPPVPADEDGNYDVPIGTMFKVRVSVPVYYADFNIIKYLVKTVETTQNIRCSGCFFDGSGDCCRLLCDGRLRKDGKFVRFEELAEITG